MPDVQEVLANIAELSPSEVLVVLRKDQQCRWEAGERIPVETYLRALADAALEDAAPELIYAEFRLR